MRLMAALAALGLVAILIGCGGGTEEQRAHRAAKPHAALTAGRVALTRAQRAEDRYEVAATEEEVGGPGPAALPSTEVLRYTLEARKRCREASCPPALMRRINQLVKVAMRQFREAG